jgi:cholesterol transport system auxiliary component
VRSARVLHAAALAVALTACSVVPPAPPLPALFDFGIAPALAAPAGAPGTVQVSAPPWLDGTAMLYRLAYGDASRLASYRDSRWAAPPAALLQERLKQRLARAAGAGSASTLRVEVEEFCQVFETPTSSRATVRVRAALLEAGTGRVLRQQAFAEEVAATTADAPGGARALVQASDAALARVIDWAAAAG